MLHFIAMIVLRLGATCCALLFSLPAHADNSCSLENTLHNGSGPYPLANELHFVPEDLNLGLLQTSLSLSTHSSPIKPDALSNLTLDATLDDDSYDPLYRSNNMSTVMETLFHAPSPPCSFYGTKNQWLFILSPGGRTGSTSVLEMVNAIPGFYLAGENEGIITEFYNLKEKWKETMSYKDVSWQHLPPWPAQLICAMQEYTKGVIGYPSDGNFTTLGFKEIRHYTTEELDTFLDFFPDSQFIINDRRSVSSQANSGFWRAYENEEDAMSRLVDIHSSFKHWAEKHKDRVFEIALEDFSVARFNMMLNWLGVEGCKYIDVAHSNDREDGDYSKMAADPSSLIKCDASQR